VSDCNTSKKAENSSSALAGTQSFTATQIARAAGLTRQAVSKGLEAIYATRQLEAEGRPADAWPFDLVPLEWRLEMTRRGVKRGFENGEQFLASIPLTGWKPGLPWDRISQHERNKALRLHKALAQVIQLLASSETPRGEVEAIGLRDFKAEFGYPVSGRHWRRLLQRTMDRDAGVEDWQRLELYLDERAVSLRPTKPQGLHHEYQHSALDEVISAMENRESPTPDDRAFLWDAVFRHYEEHTDDLTDSPRGNKPRRVFKQSLITHLSRAFPAPALCTSPASLKRRFNEKLNQWRNGGRVPQAVMDKRPAGSGRTGKKLCTACRPLVVGGAVDLDGDISQAWRRLQLAGKLCQGCASIGAFDVRRAKSEVPKSVRRDVAPDILAALPFRRGPKHARLVSPYIRRKWSDIGPGDWAECDDMTPNHATRGLVGVEVLAWDQDKAGRPFVGRMEALFQIDRRTDYPWAYLLILGDPATEASPQRKATYSSVHCRLLFLRAHDVLGMPHAGGGYVLENSVWRSRIIDGPRVQHWNASSWQGVEMGLKDPRIGLSVNHALPGNPRSKVIERMFLAIQNRMRCQPGFVGFNERQDRREVMSDFINRVKAGKEHPGNEIPQVSEFRNLLNSELMAYADEPQNGDRLPGVSPMEAFHNGIDGKPGIKEKPLRQLYADSRFLLSSHERLVPVTAQGIRFKISSSEFVFWGPELEAFQNRQIIARFNFEEPELLTCQAPDGKPFIVKARILPSSTATKEDLAETGRARANWMKRGKVIYDTLPHPFRSSVSRQTEQTEATREVGRFHNAEMEKFKTEKSKTARQTTRAREKVNQAGFDPSNLRLRNPERAAEAAERIADRLADLERKEAQQESAETNS
jgi:hypothetical protein